MQEGHYETRDKGEFMMHLQHRPPSLQHAPTALQQSIHTFTTHTYKLTRIHDATACCVMSIFFFTTLSLAYR